MATGPRGMSQSRWRVDGNGLWLRHRYGNSSSATTSGWSVVQTKRCSKSSSQLGGALSTRSGGTFSAPGAHHAAPRIARCSAR